MPRVKWQGLEADYSHLVPRSRIFFYLFIYLLAIRIYKSMSQFADIRAVMLEVKNGAIPQLPPVSSLPSINVITGKLNMVQTRKAVRSSRVRCA
jgi:hypothetical protein